MSVKTTRMISLGTLIGVLLGGIVGFYWPGFMQPIGFVGQLFLNALRILIIPLIVASIVVGVAAIGDARRTGRTAATTLLYFVTTTAIAVIIALVLVNVIAPGSGAEKSAAFVPSAVSQARQVTLTGIISSLVPANQIGAMLGGRYFGIILFSLFFGVVLTSLGSRRRTVTEFFRVVNEAILKLIHLLLYAAPVGLFCLVGSAVAANSAATGNFFDNLSYYLIALVAGLLIHGLIVLPIILKLFANRSPLEYSRNLIPAFSTALGTASSAATLPVTYDCVVDKGRVDNRAGSFVLPLGTTMNLDGTAMYVVVVTLFVAQLFGLEISAVQMAIIGLAALVTSIGAAGIPGAGILMLVVVFDVAGFPEAAYAGIGLIAAADWLMDRGRTVVNVWSDAVGAAVVAKRLDTKATARRYQERERVQQPSRTSTSQHRKEDRYRRQETRVQADQDGTGRDRYRKPSRSPSTTRTKEHVDRGRPDRPDRSRDTRTKPPKKSPFEIPTAAAASVDLETPVPPQPARTKPGRTAPDISRTKPDRSARPAPADLTRQAVERERARVTAQLAAMKKKEELAKAEVKASREAEKTKPSLVGSSDSEASVTPKNGSPMIDYSLDESETTPRPKTEREHQPATQERRWQDEDNEPDSTSSTEPHAPPVLEYGRSRLRGHRSHKDDNDPAPVDKTPSPATVATEKFSTEEQSFGRTKRKRVR